MTQNGTCPFCGTAIRGPYTSVALLGLHEIVLLIHMAHMFEQTGKSAGTFYRPDCALSFGRRRTEAMKMGTKPPVLNLSWKDSNSSVGHVIACLYRPRRLITVVTNLIQFIRPHNIYFKISLILFSIPRLDLASSLFPSESVFKMVYIFLIFPLLFAIFPSHISFISSL